MHPSMHHHQSQPPPRERAATSAKRHFVRREERTLGVLDEHQTRQGAGVQGHHGQVLHLGEGEQPVRSGVRVLQPVEHEQGSPQRALCVDRVCYEARQ